MKDKDKLRNSHSLEEAKEVWHLNAVGDPELDSGLEKRTLLEKLVTSK